MHELSAIIDLLVRHLRTLESPGSLGMWSNYRIWSNNSFKWFSSILQLTMHCRLETNFWRGVKCCKETMSKQRTEMDPWHFSTHSLSAECVVAHVQPFFPPARLYFSIWPMWTVQNIDVSQAYLSRHLELWLKLRLTLLSGIVAKPTSIVCCVSSLGMDHELECAFTGRYDMPVMKREKSSRNGRQWFYVHCI